MNKIFLIGNLVRDLELKRTKNNTAVVEFSLAVRRDKDKTDFINCVVFGTQAENLSKYQSKGSKISIVGEYRVDIYDRTDGTKGYSHYIFVNEVEYLSSKKQEVNKEEKQSMNDAFAEFGEQVDLDFIKVDELEDFLPF